MLIIPWLCLPDTGSARCSRAHTPRETNTHASFMLVDVKRMRNTETHISSRGRPAWVSGSGPVNLGGSRMISPKAEIGKKKTPRPANAGSGGTAGGGVQVNGTFSL